MYRASCDANNSPSTRNATRRSPSISVTCNCCARPPNRKQPRRCQSRLTCCCSAAAAASPFAPSCHQLHQPSERCLHAHPFISRHELICLLSLASCAADVSLAPVWWIAAPPVASAAAALAHCRSLTHCAHPLPPHSHAHHLFSSLHSSSPAASSCSHRPLRCVPLCCLRLWVISRLPLFLLFLLPPRRRSIASSRRRVVCNSQNGWMRR